MNTSEREFKSTSEPADLQEQSEEINTLLASWKQLKDIKSGGAQAVARRIRALVGNDRLDDDDFRAMINGLQTEGQQFNSADISRRGSGALQRSFQPGGRSDKNREGARTRMAALAAKEVKHKETKEKPGHKVLIYGFMPQPVKEGSAKVSSVIPSEWETALKLRNATEAALEEVKAPTHSMDHCDYDLTARRIVERSNRRDTVRSLPPVVIELPKGDSYSAGKTAKIQEHCQSIFAKHGFEVQVTSG